MMLVHAVQLSPRQSWARLGGILGTTPETLERSWRRLRDGGFAWTSAVLNASITNSGCLAYVGISCAPDAVEQVAQHLGREPEIISIAITSGKYHLFISVATSSFETMSRFLVNRVNQVPGVSGSHSMLATSLFKSGTQWRLQSLSPSQIQALASEASRPSVPESISLTPVDRELRDLLAEDGRMSFSQLGRRTGIDRSTAQRRVERMVRRGLFSIRCDVAGPDFGWPLSMTLGVNVSPAKLDDVGRRLSTELDLRVVAGVADRPNLLISVWLRSLEDVPKFETDLLKNYPEVEIARRHVNFYSSKRMGRLLTPDGRAGGVVIPTM